jgi:hypothetical protein
MAMLAAATASPREACQDRVLSLRFSPQMASATNWCWAAAGQMVMELLGEEPGKACQCRQAEEVLGVGGCCLASASCLPADSLPSRCDEPRWLAFVESPEHYSFDYRTTCDDLPDRQNDERCETRPLGWRELTSEICVGRPVIASLRFGGSSKGHTVVVMGFRAQPQRRVLVLDPVRLCPAGRECYGQLDEAFWMSYDEYAAGWGGMVHWVDFYGIRKR